MECLIFDSKTTELNSQKTFANLLRANWADGAHYNIWNSWYRESWMNVRNWIIDELRKKIAQSFVKLNFNKITFLIIDLYLDFLDCQFVFARNKAIKE